MGAARESVNRVLKAWEGEGVVSLTPGRVTIRYDAAPKALAQEAEEHSAGLRTGQTPLGEAAVATPSRGLRPGDEAPENTSEGACRLQHLGGVPVYLHLLPGARNPPLLVD